MAEDPTLRFVRSDFTALPQYSPIQPLDIIAAEIGVPIERLAKLDANENLYGPLPQVQQALHDLQGMHIYPDPAQTHLRKDLAEYIGCSVDNVVAGVGSDEILDLLIRLIDQMPASSLQHRLLVCMRSSVRLLARVSSTCRD